MWVSSKVFQSNSTAYITKVLLLSSSMLRHLSSHLTWKRRSSARGADGGAFLSFIWVCTKVMPLEIITTRILREYHIMTIMYLFGGDSYGWHQPRQCPPVVIKLTYNLPKTLYELFNMGCWVYLLTTLSKVYLVHYYWIMLETSGGGRGTTRKNTLKLFQKKQHNSMKRSWSSLCQSACQSACQHLCQQVEAREQAQIAQMPCSADHPEFSSRPRKKRQKMTWRKLESTNETLDRF